MQAISCSAGVLVTAWPVWSWEQAGSGCRRCRAAGSGASCRCARPPSILSTGTSVTSDTYSSVYSQAVGECLPHRVGALMVEPSFSFTSTPPGNALVLAARLVRALAALAALVRRRQYCASAGSANLEGQARRPR